MIEEILRDFEKDAEEIVSLIETDLGKVKAGRARPSLVENLGIEAYGSLMKLKELASITASGPHLLLVSPWDKSLVETIEKAIASGNLNLNPIVDKGFIRISVPQLTEEVRRNLVKLIYQKLESGKKLLRQARTEAKSKIERLKGQPGISEDDIARWLGDLQKRVGEASRRVEDLGKKKEEELMTI